MKYSALKNITCLLITLAGVFISVTIVIYFYLANQVSSDINSISQLTGGNVKMWGAYPGNNSLVLNKTIKFFPLQVPNGYTVDDMPAGLDCSTNVNLVDGNSYYYTNNVVFKNITLQTGSGGYATYYKNETLEDAANQILQSQDDIMMLANQGLLQGYYEEVYSPIARKMPLYLFNLKRQMMDTLPTYYAREMQIFNLGVEDYTKAVVYTPLAIGIELQDILWNDAHYGWKNAQTLGKWVQIVLSQQYANYPTFKQIQNYFQLSDVVMLGLAGKSSMLTKLTWMLNGTLSDSVYQYGASACEGLGLYCDDSELVSSQWAQGILTQKKIFLYNNNTADYSYSFNDLNSTIPLNAELGIFAPSPINANDGMNLLQIDPSTDDMWSPLINGKSFTLISYYNMANLYNNKDNFGLINFNLKLYNVTKVPPLISYLDNMESNIILMNDTYPGIGSQYTVTSAWFFFRAFTQLFNQIQDITISNLYGRAIFNSLINDQVTCDKLFTQDVIAPMQAICTKRGLKQFDVTKTAQANFPFVFAFLGNVASDDFQNLLVQLKLEEYQLSYFLYDKNSIYAKYLTNIQKDMSTYYKCLSFCTALELGKLQWFNGGVTKNLPKQYFINTYVESISEWDTNNAFPKKMFPEIYMYTKEVYGTQIDFSVRSLDSLLNTNVGSILTWSSIHNLILQNISINANDLLLNFGLSMSEAEMVINYLKHLVIEELFGGMFVQESASSFLWGYQDQFLLRKAGWKQTLGGQPWISTTRQLLQRNNWQQAANLVTTQVTWINTGLEQMSGVNNVQQILGSTQYSQNYYVWSQDSTYSNSISSLIWPYGLNQTVSGSTGFGFEINIGSGNSLNLIDEEYYRIQPLKQQDSISFCGYSVYNYTLDDSSQYATMFNDTVQGFLNMTSSAYNGLFISDLNYQSVNDQSSVSNIQVNNAPMTSQAIPSQNASTYFLVEPNTGKTVKLAKNRQNNLLFTQNLLLDPYHIQGTCYLPYNWDLLNMEYSQTVATNSFSTINSDQKTKKALLITFIVLSSVTFVAACIAIVFTYKQRVLLRRNKLSQQLFDEPIGLQQPLIQNGYTSSQTYNSGERTMNDKNIQN